LQKNGKNFESLVFAIFLSKTQKQEVFWQTLINQENDLPLLLSLFHISRFMKTQKKSHINKIQLLIFTD